ncbi:MAG: histidine kinase [Burkholderiaceae bacterium]|nr:histidine kinase [Burkholderiaceae bacterium]
MPLPHVPPAPSPDTQDTWTGVLWRELRIGVPLCAGVALFLTVVFHDPFGLNLAYSLCIGLSIQGLIEAGRLGHGRWLRRHHPGDPAAVRPWPGWHLMGPWVLASVLLGYLWGASLAGWLTDTDHLGDLLTGSLRPLAIIAIVVLAVSAGTTWVFYARGRLDAVQAQAEAARRTAAETQLRLLQSQLEPHMLFNTLANLRVLIGLDAAQAQAMLDRLIAFLRATLNASRSTTHPLAAEFERLADYLALMAVRMGPRLSVTFELPEALRSQRVPPLLLQPLVENAIRHGLEPKVGPGHIGLRAWRDGAQLCLSVQDDGVGPGPAGLSGSSDPAGPLGTHSGVGLTLVQERLSALYGDAASLSIAPAEGGGTRATVTLPLSPSPSP